MHQVPANLLITPAAIEADLTLLPSQLCGIDKSHDARASDILLVGFTPLGKQRKDFRLKTIAREAFQFLLKRQLAWLKSAITCILAQILLDSLRLKVNIIIYAVEQTTSNTADSYLIH
jgi:hypothetical protein